MLMNAANKKNIEDRLGHSIPRDIFGNSGHQSSSALSVEDHTEIHENYVTESSISQDQYAHSS